MEDVTKDGLPGAMIKIDINLVTNYLNELVLKTVEQNLNGLLEAEVDRLCGAECYERSEACTVTQGVNYLPK